MLSNVAAVFHIGNHATFKASLFMAAGIIEHEVGTRDMRRMNGLWKYMPYTGTLAIVAASPLGPSCQPRRTGPSRRCLIHARPGESPRGRDRSTSLRLTIPTSSG